MGQVSSTTAIAGLAARDGMESALRAAHAFPTDMAQSPFVHVVWEPVRQKMISSGSGLATRLLKYMCELESANDRLRISYRSSFSDNTARLPNRFKIGWYWQWGDLVRLVLTWLSNRGQIVNSALAKLRHLRVFNAENNVHCPTNSLVDAHPFLQQLSMQSSPSERSRYIARFGLRS